MGHFMTLEVHPLCTRALLVVAALFLCLPPAAAQDAGHGAAEQRSIEEKVQSALSAAPAAISDEAAVWDWPSEDGQQPPVLQDGTNGWTCFPARSTTPGNDPMCHDDVFLKWAMAFMREEAPNLDRIGLSYMLQGGGEVDENGTQTVGPHLMMAFPDLELLNAFPAAKHSNDPFVAYDDTPYALLIMPVASGGEALRLAEVE